MNGSTVRARIVLPSRRRHAIPLTSLVDVVFILLFFFMLASSYLDWRAFPLSLAGEGGDASAPVGHTLTIARDGALLDGEIVNAEQLRERLRGRAAPVVVVPEDGVPLQSLVEWLDRLKLWGVNASLARPAAS
ncbi:MAG: biopolymer transporter ExbD [Gammaproteobacteria bacterium]|nr:biopolymer transporter ExbD [Gammaproteobacteria bacterium]